MRLEFDADQRDLARALRAKLGGEPGSVHECLAGLGLYALEVPPEHGGLGFGLSVAVVVCEELGRHAASDDYRDLALAADLRPDLGAGIAAGTAEVRAAQDGRMTVRMPESAVDVVIGGALRFEGNAVSAPPPRALTRAWIRQAAYLLGLAAGAHRLAVVRAARRRQFGQPIGEHQAISFPLARQFAHLQAVRLLVHQAAWRDDHGESAALAATRALAYAAEQALETTAWAVHVHGAFGLTRYAPVHRYYELAGREALRWGSTPLLWRLADRLATSEQP
jgi:alkylation response protein AidB-like acyl-CoA dehydrogenase